MEFVRPNYLYLLGLIPLAIIFLSWAASRRQRAQNRLGNPSLIAALSINVSHRKRHWKTALWFVALGALVVALARPLWGTQVTVNVQEGVEVMVVLDVSASMLASDIRHIKPAPPALVTDRASLLSQPLYWTSWVMPLLAMVGTWLWDRRRHHLAHNVAYARAQRARRQAHKRLSEARKLIETNQDAAYAAVAHALTAYLGDKFNLPAAGLTRDAIQRTLSVSSISEELVDRLLMCLDWADSGRFAPVAAGRDVNDLIQEAEEIITQLEERIT